MTTKKKSTKKKSTRKAAKMTSAQKRKVWSEITPNAMIDIKFCGIETFDIDYDGDLSLQFGVMLPRTMLGAIASGRPQQFEADEEFDPEDYGTVYHDGDDFQFNPTDPCIHSIVITQPGKRRVRVELSSISETMVLEDGSDTISIGCRSLNKKDAELAGVAILKWCGWDITTTA